MVSSGKCGRRTTALCQHYRGTGKPVCVCQFERIRNAHPICQSILGDQIDAAVGTLLLTGSAARRMGLLSPTTHWARRRGPISVRGALRWTTRISRCERDEGRKHA